MKKREEQIVLNHALPERVLCSYCGCTMEARRSADWRGWRYIHAAVPIGSVPSTLHCPNGGKTFKAVLTALEVA